MAEPFEGYRIVTLLRDGPVADLYEATQEPLGRRVLIKALSSSILPSSPFAAVLEREAHVLSGLDHPGILRLLDFDKRADRMWLVLEHVDGWELSHLLEQLHTARPPGPRSSAVPPPGSLDLSAACAIALQIAEALAYAHRHGVAHRELAPDRVLVSRQGLIKLTGFSMILDETPSDLPEPLDGRAGYRAPEQILGEAQDPRSDFFSLGVILYELVSGRAPFGPGGETSTAQRVRHDSPQPLSRAVPTIPGALERLVARCLEKLPDDRFQSADELVQTLRGVLQELGVTDPHGATQRALLDAGLLPLDPSRDRASPSAGWTRPRERPVGVPIHGLLIAFVLLVGGGGIIQWLGSSMTDPSEAVDPVPLELAPEDAANLRVVVSPWAHVFVDGQKIATTPFAEPIPLRPGTHHVRLDHPNAVSEHRTIQLTPGEGVLLDVSMNLKLPPPEVSPLPPPEEDDSP